MLYKLIAHRGNKEGTKENTMTSFYNAINSGYSGFECDVRTAKDNKFIINHNPWYQNTLISSKNAKEWQKIGLPLLEDVLKIKTDKIIMIDVKSPFIDIEKFHKILEKYKKQNIYVISFHDKIIKALYEKERSYKVGILNYVLNTGDNHFKYDFLCILKAFSNDKIINDYQKKKKELFIYGMGKEKPEDLYPYYIVD